VNFILLRPHEGAVFKNLNEWDEPLLLRPLNRVKSILIAKTKVGAQLYKLTRHR
jgi:hypothetical protein